MRTLRFLIVVVSSIVCSAVSAVRAEAKDLRPIAVLVPGFFNSLCTGYIRVAPDKIKLEIRPYFALNIIQAIEAQGVDAVVVNTLSPVGSLEDNGERLIRFLDKMKAIPQYQGRPIHLIGHSAGGLYSFYAISRRPDIGVKSLTTLSTPFHGVEFINALADHVPGLEAAVNFMQLQSLPQLQPENVARFMASFDLPKNFVVKVFAGEQKQKFNQFDARGLSWPMAAVNLVIGKRSDGIVSVESSYATGILLKTQGPMPVEKAKNTIPLEHWEQTLDYRVFALLGIMNAHYIRDQQNAFYGSLARNLKATK
jgi:hypothetical protein